VLIAEKNKLFHMPLKKIFNEKIHLQKGQFIVRFEIQKEYTALPYIHVKKTKNEKIDYPLLTIAALKKGNTIRLGMSGLCRYPFRSEKVENHLNDSSISYEERCSRVLKALPSDVLNDISGSGEYRKFVLKNTLMNILEKMEGM